MSLGRWLMMNYLNEYFWGEMHFLVKSLWKLFLGSLHIEEENHYNDEVHMYMEDISSWSFALNMQNYLKNVTVFCICHHFTIQHVNEQLKNKKRIWNLNKVTMV